MQTLNRYRYRSKDILSLFKKHGPLSFSALHKILEPPMKKSSLRKSLQLLKKKGAVSTRMSNGGKVFYEISQKVKGREVAAKILDCQPNELFQAICHDRDWVHTELTEYWIALFQNQFPEAIAIRESDFYTNDVAQKIMLIKKDEFELRPDFLLLFPKTAESERVSVAVEIERSRKSTRRLAAKVKKYADQTFVDGLIYVCDSNRISETIRLIYRNKILDRAHRIKHYADHFLLFSSAINTYVHPMEHIFDSAERRISVDKWMEYLRSTKRNSRRDSEFRNVDSGSPSPSV